MNAGLKGVTEGDDAVGGEKQYALKVFEEAEEDADEGVAAHGADFAFFEEDVGFVGEEKGTPAVGYVDDWGEISIAAFGPKITLSVVDVALGPSVPRIP